ncbi:MAG: type II toxin-antitoxin system Phd/YefM family antitoxin [Pyrinomonadaceae bacterium]
MFEVNAYEADLSHLLERVASGEEILISKAGVPVARLVPAQIVSPPRVLGQDVGKGWIADDFDMPLSDDLKAAFEGTAQ